MADGEERVVIGDVSRRFMCKLRIEQFCNHMQQMVSDLTLEIKALCCGSREPEDILELLAHMQSNISKLRSRSLIPFLRSAVDIRQNYRSEISQPRFADSDGLADQGGSVLGYGEEEDGDYDGLLEGVLDLFGGEDGVNDELYCGEIGDLEGSDADQHGGEEVAVHAMDPSEDADQLKKKEMAEEDIQKMEKMQLIPYKYTGPKYRYSKEEDTELTRWDKEKLKQEEVIYDLYCQDAKSWCDGSFCQTTALNSMVFAHCTPRQIPYRMVTIQATLQIFSFKIMSCELSWPLYVYGVVAARDRVDGHRNILFGRRRDDAQLVTQDDPYLGLSGPSRAISAADPVEFEVELKLKCRTESRDIPLLKRRAHDSCAYSGLRSIRFNNYLCKTKLRLEQLGCSVQATFLSVCLVEGSPRTFKYGGRVSCSSLAHQVMVTDSQGNVTTVSDSPSTQVVLIDSRGEMPMDKTGVLDLARCVVSVPLVEWNEYSLEYQESLKVSIQAYSQSGDIAAEAHVKLRPKLSKTSRVECVLGDSSKVEITVVWSVMPQSPNYLFRGEYV
uniref:Uncharacterized protein n=1 Tax=Avena sativa TaxID=4498 RepID=A0ACD5T7W5_AVESA